MAIGDNEISEEDNSTDMSGVSEIDSEDEDEIEVPADLENLTWTDERPGNVEYEHLQFTAPARGPIKSVTTYLECIELYLTENVINLIVTETNRVIVSHRTKTINRRLLTASELWLFITVAMLGEIHNKNVPRDNWSTDKMLYTPIFGKLMPRERYEEISKFLHFVDNTIRVPSGDKFWKIRKLFNLFNDAFQTEFNADRTVSVDESMMLWRGNHSLRRYIPSKADKWGIKFYVLAESRSGYVWRILVDEGKQTKITINRQFPNLQKPGLTYCPY